MTRLDDRTARRLRIVEEHVRQENLHDLAGIMETFGAAAEYEDEPWGERFTGRDGVRSYYEHLIGAVPDLEIVVERRHVSGDSVILEVTIKGTHTGNWHGFPGTGRSVEFPLCAIYSFDEDDKLAGERIYYDRATVLQQLGLHHDPKGPLGRVLTPLMHPVTTLRALGRLLFKR